MIVNRKDDIDPSDTRFEWMVLVLLGNEFCIYTDSSKLDSLELSSRGIGDGWPVIDDEA